MKCKSTLILLFSLLAFAACNSSSTRSFEDYSLEVYTPHYASGFDLRAAPDDSSTLITIRNPWQGASDVEQHLLILGPDDKVPTGLDVQWVRTPVKRVVCMSSSHVAMFDAIGQAERIAGVSGLDYISNPIVLAGANEGKVHDVGYDTNLDFELLASMRPDLCLLYGVTKENTAVTDKLRELGIPYIYIGDYMEESPLGKAEWLVVAAEVCGMRDTGITVFDGIAARYNTLKTQIADQTQSSDRPTVMLNTPYRDTWFMPSTRSFMVRLIDDAGGKYIYTKNDSDTSVAVDMEEAYLLASQADIWLNVGTCNTLAELKSQNPKFANIAPVQNRRVYNNNRRQTPAGGSDFWESGVIHPDRVLQDLRSILNPADGDTTALYYYKQLK